MWYPDRFKSYRKGSRFKTFEDAQNYMFANHRKGNVDGDIKVEIHTGSPSKIKRGANSKTLQQAGTFKSFADQYENSRLAVIKVLILILIKVKQEKML